jgi:hypothetical protein
MRCAIIGAVFATACAADTPRAEDVPVVLKRAALEPLEGVWELKAVPSGGYRGTVRATVTLYRADGAASNFGRLVYDFDLADETSQIQGDGVPKGGVSFGVVKRGASTALVTSQKFSQPAPFEVVATVALVAPFDVKGDELTLDVSKSLKAFVPGFITPLQIDWGKTKWERVKK